MADWLFIAVIYTVGAATGAVAMTWVYRREFSKARAQAGAYRKLWIAERESR